MKKIVIAMVLFSVALGAPACERKGPMEKAGEAIDETVDKVTHPNEGAVEKTGRKIDEAVDDATD
jgi:hypothetical protein